MSENRDRAGYFRTLAKSLLVCFSNFTVVTVGLLGLIGSAGIIGVFAWQGNRLNAWRNPIVFKAGPTNCKLMFPPILLAGRAYAPPPYFKVTLSNSQLKHSRPSKSIGMLAYREPSSLFPDNGGMIGTNGLRWAGAGAAWGGADFVWAKAGCRTVDVWFPKKNMQSAPNMNDPNATVTIRITPPSDRNSSCTNWRTHYGSAPKGKRRGVMVRLYITRRR